MDQKYKLLIVEDSPDDIELIVNELDRTKLSFDYDSIKGIKNFSTLFSQEKYDIVLCDYYLEDSTAFDVIEHIKSKKCHLPVVLVSGRVGEELAVEIMRKGVKDYVFKDNLARLGAVVRREIEDYQSKKLLDKTQKELTKQSYLSELLLDNIPGRAYLAEKDTYKLLAVNQTAVKEGMSVGDTCHHAIYGIDKPCEDCLVPELKKSGKDQVLEAFEKNKFFNKYWVDVNKDIFFQYTLDITTIKDADRKEKEYQKQLVVAKEKAEEADKLKTAFLANMSHEIRTPLNAIIGFTEFLVDDNMSREDKKSYIDIIMNSSNQLLDIINDLMDISRIESGSMVLEKEEMDLNALFEEFQLRYEKSLKLKEKEFLNLVLENPFNGGNVKISNDRNRFIQVMNNLFENAVKFTSKGAITIGCEKNKKGFLTFYVKDTGVGIDNDKFEYIFKRFCQGDDSLRRTHGGTGLGLAISKSLVELMGGSINVESEPGKGSKFSFDIPVSKKLARQLNELLKSNYLKKHKKDVQSSHQKVLVVEDEPANFYYLEALLKRNGIDYVWAQSGKECLNLFDTDSDISMILMDIRLPDIDGLELTKHIRTKNKEIPIIAQSAYAYTETKEKATHYGCNDYLTKPIASSQFKAVMDKYVGQQRAVVL